MPLALDVLALDISSPLSSHVVRALSSTESVSAPATCGKETRREGSLEHLQNERQNLGHTFDVTCIMSWPAQFPLDLYCSCDSCRSQTTEIGRVEEGPGGLDGDTKRLWYVPSTTSSPADAVAGGGPSSSTFTVFLPVDFAPRCRVPQQVAHFGRSS